MNSLKCKKWRGFKLKAQPHERRVTCKNSFLREEDDGIGNLKYVPRACVRKVKP